MKKSISFVLGLFFICGFAASASELEDNFGKLADEILENLQMYHPVTSTYRGIHKYNDKFTNYSSRAVRDEITTLRQFEKRLHNYKYSSLSESSKINWKLLKSNVDLALHELQKVRSHTKNPYQYIDEAVNGIYYILASEYAPMEARLAGIIGRMRGVPKLLEQARDNLKEPAPIHIKLARELIADGKAFYESAASELASEYPNMAGDISEASAKALAAMDEYDLFLQNIVPGSETAFALGKSDYDYRLASEHFLDFDSDSLLKLGEALLAQYDSAYRAYEEWMEDSVVTDSEAFLIECIDKETVMKYLDWELNKVKEFIVDRDLITVPDDIGKCRIVETPKFLLNVIGSIAYHPPGVYSPVQTGMFYIRPLPDEFDDKYVKRYSDYIQKRKFRGGIVHEAYPGHHFQFQMSSKVTDKVRKWQEDPMYYEGWALYCEEMMYHQGLYGIDHDRWLRVINGIRFRAARIIIDVKLQTGVWTPNQAADWIYEKFGDEPSDTAWAQREVNWYTLYPTVPMSYLVGKLEVLRLRNGMMAREGENFSLKVFHDRFLSEGMLPPPLIREVWGL